MGRDRDPAASPYPYQIRFADQAAFPHLLRAPTSAGKTATAILGWLYRVQTRPKDTPRRLVYCLPMRVLVEKSELEARRWIANLKLDIPVHVLMGGVDSTERHLHPERPAVLIGTQDMLLSRALNRGYAASRFHWPIDFGLLNNDCLWVFDEPQLMANGVSTSAQLAGLRNQLGTDSNSASSARLTITEHTGNVCRELNDLLEAIDLVRDWSEPLVRAARWHDLGKAHLAFQQGMQSANPDLDGKLLWAKSGVNKRLNYVRKHFRHELASGLAALQQQLPFAVAYLAAAHTGGRDWRFAPCPAKTNHRPRTHCSH